MAWASLCLPVLAALGGPSCLVTASPEFAQPKQTPPFLTNLTPNPYQIQKINTVQGSTTPGYLPPDPVTFDVVSEDLQSPGLQALLLLDFQGFGLRYDMDPLNLLHIDAGHLDTPTRHESMTFGIPPSVSKGCHSVTLLVSHEFVKTFTNTIVPKTPGDLATATWWYQVGVDSANPSLDITTCTVATGDAAVEAGEGGGS
jgi:hypothetical protein